MQVSLILKKEIPDLRVTFEDSGENCGKMIDLKQDKKHIQAKFENDCKNAKTIKVKFSGKETGYQFELPAKSPEGNFKFAASSCANTGSHSQVFRDIKNHEPELFL